MPVAAEPAPKNRNLFSLRGRFVMRVAASQTREHDGGGALNVVIETKNAIAVLVQQRIGVGGQEIFELEERAGKHVLNAHDELFHELAVVAAAEPCLTKPQIERVGAHRLVVGPDVEHHGKAHGGVDSSARRIERQFSNRYSHATRTQVSQTQDALAVGDDDDLDVSARPIPQHVRDAAAVVGAYV